MKKNDRNKRAVRLEKIGLFLIFTSWLLPSVFLDPREQAAIVFGITLAQSFVGAFFCISGVVIEKRVRIDPFYVVPRNLFRLFNLRQFILMAAPVLFFISCYLNAEEATKGSAVCIMYIMCGCLAVAAVLGIVQHIKDRKNYVSVGGGKMIRTGTLVSSVVLCSCCKSLCEPKALREYNGKRYCPSCFNSTSPAKSRMGLNAGIRQNQCCICQRTLFRELSQLQSGGLICEDCIREANGGVL